MDYETLVRRVQQLILRQLELGDRLGRDAQLRAASLAEQVLATARGATTAELLRDALERLALARAEWQRAAEDPDGHGAAALAELTRDLAALHDEATRES
ncbi:MAG TPA: hypothetical protein VFF06_36810 [Polyangia bacterium]|nr:hypothetical protein [Polyangia bacterium]